MQCWGSDVNTWAKICKFFVPIPPAWLGWVFFVTKFAMKEKYFADCTISN